ncbi:LytR/AlgR family response regulator transcription factor [Mucilaginibacter sp.]|uniref:LytR/AlgR family response regulator transcription factor n=1 Tax=Mucilaginibacter sp. TaxID=1882438 RepID=UPI0035BBA663
MNIISCYVVDDEAGAITLLKEYIERTPGLELIGSSIDPVAALDDLTSSNAPDITFLDVDMRLLSGMDLAGMVNLYTTVVFTTAFSQYALQAFEKEAFDFLLKPITYERFAKCIQHAKRKRKLMAKNDYPIREDFFNIKSETKGKMIKVKFNELIYIEGADNYIHIHTTAGKHTTYLTMKDMESFLPKPLFARIHRSFLINVNHVKVIERGQIRMENGYNLVMGDYYKKRFLDLMDEHLVKTDR